MAVCNEVVSRTLLPNLPDPLNRTRAIMPQLQPSRRGFLKATGGLVLASSAPAILAAEDKSGLKPQVIGPEGHRYEVHHDCMQIPPHIRWQDTHGVAVDAAGLVYVKHRTMTADPQDAVVGWSMSNTAR